MSLLRVAVRARGKGEVIGAANAVGGSRDLLCGSISGPGSRV